MVRVHLSPPLVEAQLSAGFAAEGRAKSPPKSWLLLYQKDLSFLRRAKGRDEKRKDRKVKILFDGKRLLKEIVEYGTMTQEKKHLEN